MSIQKLIDSSQSRIEAIESEMSQPDVASDPQRMKKIAREHRRLKELIELHDRIEKLKVDIIELHEAAEDPELAELAAAELPSSEKELERLEGKLMTLLVPEDPADSRNAVLEIRAGSGGDEAALFGADLYKMYTRYFEKRHWKVETISGHFSDLGGIKELTVTVSGDGVYGILKMESGVHRVQRVPTTETSGRLHTSAASVAVLPEAQAIDVEIDDKDLRIDTFRSSGPGGQHVNKTDSAIRITHLPTNIVVSCQDEKSQLKNKNQAMKVLRSRLLQIKIDEEEKKRSAQRRSQISTGDRSAKIRTYNFPQNRITDHRGPLTIHRLEEVLAGEMDVLLEPLAEHFAREKLEEVIEALGNKE